jgi:hypothetical protein
MRSLQELPQAATLISARFDVGNHQLHGLVAAKLVDVELVGQLHPLMVGFGQISRSMPKAMPSSFTDHTRSQHHFQVPLADDALLDQLEHPMEQRLRKCWPQGPAWRSARASSR